MSENNELEALDLKSLAIETLRQVCLDKAAPSQSRAAAARSIAEIVGLLGKNAEVIADVSTKSLSELSVQDLDKEIARISRKVSS